MRNNSSKGESTQSGRKKKREQYPVELISYKNRLPKKIRKEKKRKQCMQSD